MHNHSAHYLRRKQASLDPLANLTKGNYFALDNTNGLLLEVDNYKIPVWEVKKEELDLKSITEAVRLDNRNTLILDSEGNSIIELTPKGRTTWKYNPDNADSQLNNPRGLAVLSNNDILIADTDNHRVMEMDFDGHIIWQYGITGSKGTEFNTLNQPTSIQKTYDGTYLISDTGNNRLVEISRDLDTETGIYKIKKVWQYGNPDNILGQGEGRDEKHLNAPTMAFRNIEGHTMILDKGNQRVIELDHNDEIKWEYKTGAKDLAAGFTLVKKTGEIEKILADSRGAIWVAAIGDGLLKMDSRTSRLQAQFTVDGPAGSRLWNNNPKDILQYNDSLLVVAA
ncbi:MAG: hypothetical protein EOP49_06245, partial [Sphingobacteriales bacterium]